MVCPWHKVKVGSFQWVWVGGCGSEWWAAVADCSWHKVGSFQCIGWQSLIHGTEYKDNLISFLAKRNIIPVKGLKLLVPGTKFKDVLISISAR